ncbi:hypothetical protein BDQ17DRAFT_1343050 [Cyathus striatus]|nr:hypothetical protein BDQ17DRAFT_1343050 [Cyathus striatus]
MRARPVGKHRHFHVLAIRNAIHQTTGRMIRVETIWKKLRDCWDLDALDAIDVEAESYVVPRRGTSSKPISIRSPSPSENLARHAFFRQEFSLPYFDPTIQSLLDARRLRDSVSVASTPPATPTPGRKRKSKADMAGLVAGDSDSSALTQESADEGGVGIEGSVVTGTDGGEDSVEDEDVDMRDPSPEPVEEPPSEQPMPRRRGRPPKNRGRGRGAAPAPATRGAKKRKRG